MLNQFKQFVKDNQQDIILIIGIILIALISFGAGRLTSQTSNYGLGLTDSINTPNTPAPPDNSINDSGENLSESGKKTLNIQIVGNKNSKIYHYPWCSGAKNMKEENKIFFNSTEEAKKAGFKPAGNCPGL